MAQNPLALLLYGLGHGGSGFLDAYERAKKFSLAQRAQEEGLGLQRENLGLRRQGLEFGRERAKQAAAAEAQRQQMQQEGLGLRRQSLEIARGSQGLQEQQLGFQKQRYTEAPERERARSEMGAQAAGRRTAAQKAAEESAIRRRRVREKWGTMPEDQLTPEQRKLAIPPAPRRVGTRTLEEVAQLKQVEAAFRTITDLKKLSRQGYLPEESLKAGYTALANAREAAGEPLPTLDEFITTLELAPDAISPEMAAQIRKLSGAR